MTSLPPLEQSRYFSFITKGLSAENILRWQQGTPVNVVNGVKD